jgi:L-alanine-DL-glutamate epimerase-like enolase superfamily enzyme
LPPGAARNAVDCALWDLEAKLSGQPAHVLAGRDRLAPVTTAYTLSLDTPEAMGAAARAEAGRPILKVKLGGGEEDMDRLRAVRAHAPQSRLVVDANEGWSPDGLAARLAALAELGVDMVEQPLPADADAALGAIARPLPVIADESAHDRRSLDRLAGRYDLVNIKLDKTGGLTEALALAAAARSRGLGLMVGCMVGTSLAMAPALILAQDARLVDLDAPLLLARDREPGLVYDGSVIAPPDPALWG